MLVSESQSKGIYLYEGSKSKWLPRWFDSCCECRPCENYRSHPKVRHCFKVWGSVTAAFRTDRQEFASLSVCSQNTNCTSTLKRWHRTQRCCFTRVVSIFNRWCCSSTCSSDRMFWDFGDFFLHIVFIILVWICLSRSVSQETQTIKERSVNKLGKCFTYRRIMLINERQLASSALPALQIETNWCAMNWR